MAIVSVIVLLLLAFAYGGYRRTLSNQAAARDAGLPRNVTPATQAGTEFMQATPAGTVPMTRSHADDLRPPDASSSTVTASCGADPRTGQPYRFNPQTGQLCDGLPQERVVVRQPNADADAAGRTDAGARGDAGRSPARRRVPARAGSNPGSHQHPQFLHVVWDRQPGTPVRSGSDDLSQVEALSRALGARQGGDSVAVPNGQAVENDYDSQNMQSRKEAFLSAARNRQADDYLRSTREAPLSRYEIKAGWEIPAVLEQSLNSDLPGELKALVTSNVYDTATGLYLLIPQGSRLIGKYDSHVSYGQDGVQVAWSRIIYPDASSVDLDGMMGLDSHGNAGLRDQGRPPLSPHNRILGPYEHVHRRVRNLSANQPERSHVPDASADRRKRGRPGTQPNRRSDHPAQPERATDDQGPGRVQVHGPREPRHPFRSSIRAGLTRLPSRPFA